MLYKWFISTERRPVVDALVPIGIMLFFMMLICFAKWIFAPAGSCWDWATFSWIVCR